jgi:hypothetical protein
VQGPPYLTFETPAQPNGAARPRSSASSSTNVEVADVRPTALIDSAPVHEAGDVGAERSPGAGRSPKPTPETETELRRLWNKSPDDLTRLCTDKDAYACFLAALQAWDENIEFAHAANWRACKLKYVPEACALFLTEQLPKIENRDQLSPKQLLRVVEAACSYQREFCELLADQSLKQAALGDIRGQFPDTVAGFKFGDAMQRVEKDCRGRRGRWVHDGSDIAACTQAPVNPFSFGDAFVLLQFCGDSLCEVALVFLNQPHLTTTIRQKLQQKYGEAAPSEPATVCARSPQAVPTGDQPFRWTWTDRRADHTARQISYDFSCDNGEALPRSPTVWYRNVAGSLRRMNEFNEKRSNF